jgi:hypothetical protein
MKTTRQVLLRRFRYLEQEILGTVIVFDQHGQILFDGMSIELAYRDNMRNMSCVPSGDYPLVLEHSNRFDELLWEIKGVPERSECKFHVANYYRQINGCIGLGREHADVDGDGFPDVTHSRDTMALFHAAMSPATNAYLRIIGLA